MEATKQLAVSRRKGTGKEKRNVWGYMFVRVCVCVCYGAVIRTAEWLLVFCFLNAPAVVSLIFVRFFFVSGGSVSLSDHYWEQPFSQPYFDNTTRREVTTTVGQTAHLHCRVRNLGDRAVHIIINFYKNLLSKYHHHL